MVGNPGESEGTVAQMKRLLRRLPLDDIHISFFTPLPGSDAYKFADKFGKFDKNWDSMDVYSPNFIPHGLSRSLLLKYRAKLYLNFYLRPRVFLRYLVSMLSPKRMPEIFKKGLFFLDLLRCGK